MVYVIGINGNALMPTARHGKARRLLKNGLAVVVSYNPFTIKLTYQPKPSQTQQVTLGVDLDSKHVGLSASTEKKELFIQSRRSTGWFELKESLTSKGTVRIKSSELKLLERNKTIITNKLGRSSIPVQH